MNILTFDIEEWFHILDNESTKTINKTSIAYPDKSGIICEFPRKIGAGYELP